MLPNLSPKFTTLRYSESLKPLIQIMPYPLCRFAYFYTFLLMILFVHFFTESSKVSIFMGFFFSIIFEQFQHPNPIGNGLGNEAIVEAAGPDCIVPGQTVPIKLLGLKVLLFYQSLFHSSGYAFIMRENQFSGCYGFLWHLWGNKFACTTSKTQFK